ncbi:hypothetical protein [Ruminococcus sp. AM42-11]|uniref:hypothetical protein n=1 Tax=Ruminococcus sp. AM42-11 TaxID=2292372 RepID=UPI0026C0F414
MDKNDNIVMISKDIRANERYIRERLADCGDIQIRKMRLGDERKVDCLMVYIEVATSNMMLEDSAIGKWLGISGRFRLGRCRNLWSITVWELRM